MNNKIRKAFNKSAHSYNKHAVLQQEIASRLFNNIKLIKIEPKNILDLGAGTGFLTHKLYDNYNNSQIIALDFAQESLKINVQGTNIKAICADTYQLPFADNSIDIIVSNLMLQWCSNYQELFTECFRVLKKNAVFMFTTFGIDTLKELKSSWNSIDSKTHINNFVDMHIIGDTLLQQGFIDPVMEMEVVTMTYNNVKDVIQDLKGIGANTVIPHNSGLLTPRKFNKMCDTYETLRTNGKLPASYEIIYGHCFVPSNDGFIQEVKISS